MTHLGEEGYLERTKLIMEVAGMIAKGVKDIPGLYLQGEVGGSRRRNKSSPFVVECAHVLIWDGWPGESDDSMCRFIRPPNEHL